MLRQLQAGLSLTGTSNTLATLTHVDYSEANAPDFLAVRTGAGVTGQLAGGGTTTGWVDDKGNSAIVFASGNEPNALKGVAITFGASTSAAEMDNIKQRAMTYLNEHLGDQEVAPGVWNRPLLDTKA